MKISKNKLKQIIKEEILSEVFSDDRTDRERHIYGYTDGFDDSSKNFINNLDDTAFDIFADLIIDAYHKGAENERTSGPQSNW